MSYPPVQIRSLGNDINQKSSAKEVWLTSSTGAKARFFNYGATLAELHIPTKKNQLIDVILGFDSLDEYINQKLSAGVIVGRIAGRLRESQFEIDRKIYHLRANDGKNLLHGGKNSMSYQFWEIIHFESDIHHPSVTFGYYSFDGEEGFPGNVCIQVTYRLTPQNALEIEYQASTDQPTPLSFTSHPYFNLNGEGDILGHTLKINADQYFTTDSSLYHYGKKELVIHQSADFQKNTLLKDRVRELYQEHGDLYWLGPKQSDLREVAELTSDASGLTMKAWSTESCLQFYTGRYIPEGTIGKKKRVYSSFSGLCLECQGYPEAIRYPEYGSIILTPSENYYQKTVYRFF